MGGDSDKSLLRIGSFELRKEHDAKEAKARKMKVIHGYPVSISLCLVRDPLVGGCMTIQD